MYVYTYIWCYETSTIDAIIVHLQVSPTAAEWYANIPCTWVYACLVDSMVHSELRVLCVILTQVASCMIRIYVFDRTMVLGLHSIFFLGILNFSILWRRIFFVLFTLYYCCYSSTAVLYVLYLNSGCRCCHNTSTSPKVILVFGNETWAPQNTELLRSSI